MVFSATSEVSLINHEDRGRERNKDLYTGCLSKVIELTKAVDMLYTHTTIMTIESSALSSMGPSTLKTI